MRGGELVGFYDAENPKNKTLLYHFPNNIINDFDEKLIVIFFEGGVFV
jgi:hypothetical protein